MNIVIFFTLLQHLLVYIIIFQIYIKYIKFSFLGNIESIIMKELFLKEEIKKIDSSLRFLEDEMKEERKKDIEYLNIINRSKMEYIDRKILKIEQKKELELKKSIIFEISINRYYEEKEKSLFLNELVDLLKKNEVSND